MAGASTARARSRSIAHRWGPIAPVSSTEQLAVGIRFDEDEGAAVDSFLLRLSPGELQLVEHLPGLVAALTISRAGRAFLIGTDGVLVSEGRRHAVSGAHALAPLGDEVAVAAADRLWVASGDGSHVAPGLELRARLITPIADGIVLATDEERLLWTDGSRQREVALPPGLRISALGADDTGRIVVVAGRDVLFGDLERVVPVAKAPFDVQCAAVYQGRVLLASRARGLFVWAPDQGDVVAPLKPSLRAHTLVVRAGQLAVASDLFCATSDDGVEFLTRDLARFMRVAGERALLPSADAAATAAASRG